MRHLGSVILSLLLGPLVYVLTGVGLVKMEIAESAGVRSEYLATSIALGALAAAGLLYAILVMARISPLGPVLLGLAYVAMTAWTLLEGRSFLRTVPGDIPGARGAVWAPAGAVTALLAVPLLATIVSPRRWRRYANPPATDQAPAAAPAYPGEPAYPGAPAYSAAPTYQPMAYPVPTSGPPAPPPSSQSPDATVPISNPAGQPEADSRATAVLPPRPAQAPTSAPPPAPTSAPPAPTSTPPAPTVPTSPAASPPSTTQTWPVTDEPVDPEATRKPNP